MDSTVALLISFLPVVVFYLVKVDKFYTQRMIKPQLIALRHGIDSATTINIKLQLSNFLNKGFKMNNVITKLVKSQDADMIFFETLFVSIGATFYFMFSAMDGLQETLLIILK